MLYSWDEPISRNHPVLPIEEFPALALLKITTPYYPIFALLTVKSSLTGGKNKRKFKLLAIKVAAVAYNRWSLTSSEVPNRMI